MKPWSQRTLVRASFAAGLVLLASLRSSLGDGLDSSEILDIVQNTLIAFGGWYGFGAIPGVGNYTEPFLNNDKPGSVDVPIPPADPEPDQAAPYSRT